MRLLAWLWVAASWVAAASSSILTQIPKSIIMPENKSASIICGGEAQNDQNAFFWYRQTNGTYDFQFLMHTSTIGRETRAKGIEQRFKTTLRPRPEFCVLKISMLKKEDSGMYYCAISHGGTFTAASRINLTVGELPPPPPPTTKPTKPKPRKPCHCSSGILKTKGFSCGSLVLGPLAAGAAALLVAVVSTLYYFSRLPKKCRHRMIKKKLLH
ncbi:T-cell surface glycoprotein CD8 beta chain-like [Acipenser oxyrinchus oxyrinchus]|uniref:T-cell surface glycoprotein CD8 beta chain-like n=1 Tax=Acipenser oxyrinchus oxyrinchus TaxID=40147 RepID=A0AAD8LVH2_ACIOX|nr:T-cell surface glycoprotein CD8 beta chain-like [Acipenser oxyrinchus oxyrinchus]